nr:DUF948 domain-containing protein [Leptolyngbya sp. FACHB-541]
MLVAVSLTAVLIVALPALRELARAARSAEKLFDTLSRELPPTLEAIRLTGLEISDLTDEVSEGVQNAGQVVQQVNQSISGVRQGARQAQVTTRGVFAGVKAAWKVFQRPSRRPERLSASSRSALELDNSYRQDFAQREDVYSAEPEENWNDQQDFGLPPESQSELEEIQRISRNSAYLRKQSSTTQPED